MKRPKMLRTGLSTTVLCLCTLILLVSCGSQAPKKKHEKIIPVTVAAVSSEDVPYTLSAVGNVTPLATVDVKSRVGGIIEKQFVRNGQDVRKGDLLFRIDPRPFDLVIMEAKAKLDRDRAHLDKAREDLRRYSKLRQMNVVAQEQYDNTYAEATSLESTIRLNEAELKKAELDLEYTAITAPISGRIGVVQVNEGNVIKANDDRTLCVINQIHPINVSFSLPERYLGEIMERLAQGPMKVMVAPSGNNQRKAEVELAAVDNAVDSSTGTIRLLASYQNKDNMLWPGQFARVHVTLRTLHNALLLPTGAILPGLESSYVYVVVPDKNNAESGTVEPRNITTSIIVGKRTVVDSGLKEGEVVVLAGQVALQPGARVSIKNTPKAEKQTEGNEEARQ